MALTRSASRQTIGVTRARQGRLGRNILYVLLTALLLVVLGFFAAWTWRSGDFASVEPNNGKQPADAQVFNAPEPGATARQTPTEGPKVGGANP